MVVYIWDLILSITRKLTAFYYHSISLNHLIVSKLHFFYKKLFLIRYCMQVHSNTLEKQTYLSSLFNIKKFFINYQYLIFL